MISTFWISRRGMVSTSTDSSPAGRPDMPATVDQRQRATRAQRAQVGQGEAPRVQAGSGGVGGHRGVLKRRDGRQIVDDAGLAGRQNLVLRHLDQEGSAHWRRCDGCAIRWDYDFVKLRGRSV